MKKPILNVNEVELQPRPRQFAAPPDMADRYEARAAMVSQMLGAQKLGYNITAVPPGKRAFPCHSHRVNEEMFFILQGRGEVRIGKERYPLKAGDIVACPPGTAETAHQIINTGDEELRYLAVSTKLSPEICDYPDTGKFAILGEGMRYVGRESQGVGYWEGE